MNLFEIIFECQLCKSEQKVPAPSNLPSGVLLREQGAENEQLTQIR